MHHMTGNNRARTGFLRVAAMLSGALLLVLFAGCASPGPVPPSPAPSPTASGPDLAGFIAAANDCRDANLMVSGDIGTFSYTVVPGCVFTKTLVRLNGSETQQIKTLLEGKNMTCTYTKGQFDQRLVTTLVGGMEGCTGDLKDDLASLVIFT
jgi:hypothetical protein